MFTGIVEELARVRAFDGTRLRVESRTVADEAMVGDSVAVNGACLTVVERQDATLSFDVSPETLSTTALGELALGDPVNLERPLTLLSRLGGHLVQGHVDGVGEVASVREEGEGRRMTIRVPGRLTRYVAQKGSVTVDGVSLTVARVDGDAFEVALVPHTLSATTLGERRERDPVNLETDVLAKYVRAVMAG